MVHASIGMRLVPDYRFENAPACDILLVPGASDQSLLDAINNEMLISWVRRQGSSTPLTLSASTGTLLLAAAGLLDGKQATTYLHALDLLRQFYPNVHVVYDSKIVDAGNVITCQGGTAGVDLGLYVVKRLLDTKDCMPFRISRIRDEGPAIGKALFAMAFYEKGKVRITETFT